ncbi:leucine-rich repeat-domain-containing protein [Lipomyces oligophaga]|uniref:leucine-rich repeat-domain-containing protein n=1 Tax=Lipomyces oligophaga TaxID=45792 RepID=UPI0034CE88B8
MKLTADLINGSPSYINPLKDRELNLRGHRIPALENLGATKDLNDAIDLTDNDLTSLANIPSLPHLRRLLLARNKISSISPSIATSVPNLTTLILTHNQLSNLSDILPLQKLSLLTYISFLENPITRHEHYRLFLIWAIPSVRILDFNKVKKSEREEATQLFGTIDEPTDLAAKYSAASLNAQARVFNVDSNGNHLNGKSSTLRNKLTAQEKEEIMEQLRNAKSLGEIERLEQVLRRIES